MQEGAADQPAEAVHLVSWRRTHPLLRYVSLDQVLVSRTIRMTLPGGEGSGCEAVAWGPDGPVIAVCGQNSGGSGGGVRRIVIGFDLAHTNWGPDLSFPIFINNAVDFLTGGSGGGMGRSFTTAEVVGVKAAAGVKELRVSGPMEFRVRVPEGPGIREGEDTTVALGVLERAGLYRVQGAAPPDDVVPVNLCDAFESRLSTADRINLPGAAIAAGNGEDEGAREVWHWFVGGALVLLTVEWFVFAWKSRL
jgi:hypothetical protein